MRKATREIKIKRKTVRKVRTVNVKSKGRRPERSESCVSSEEEDSDIGQNHPCRMKRKAAR